MTELNCENVNLYDIPLSAINLSKKIILIQLDARLYLRNKKNNIERDWQGLATLAGICPQAIPAIRRKASPTEEIFKLWKNNSIGLLLDYLEIMERMDIREDIEDLIDKDVINFIDLQNKANITTPQLVDEIDKEILTNEDVLRIENGLSPQKYDAFLLYSEEDSDFAFELLRRMEQDYNFKLCLKDRDLVGGLTFEHDAIMRLIAERCNRLIIIISNNFLKSDANKFFVNFAQYIAIEKRRRMIIPCLIEKCQIPYNLSYMFIIDYTKSGKLFDFWVKLRESIRINSSQTRLPLTEQSMVENTQLAITDGKNIPHQEKALEVFESSNTNSIENIKIKECTASSENINTSHSKLIRKSRDFKKWFNKTLKSKKPVKIASS